MRLLTGYLTPDGGETSVYGMNIAENLSLSRKTVSLRLKMLKGAGLIERICPLPAKIDRKKVKKTE